jgi:hypothetical protein
LCPIDLRQQTVTFDRPILSRKVQQEETDVRPISDKAEVSIDFPDKFYVGSFERDSSFEAKAEGDGLFFRLTRSGEEKRVVGVHLHHFVLAGILADWADTLKDQPPVGRAHATELIEALKKVEKALARRK